METPDLLFLRRAWQLALLGQGSVSPNPLVGAVLVNEQGLILSEGWHQQFGGPHAEVNCLAPIPESTDLSRCTLYVTLEPCSHTGKTPPCADLLIRRGLGRVVITQTDPNPLVSGQGIAKLLATGISVEVAPEGALPQPENAYFFQRMTRKKPYIILKWAMTQDGYIGAMGGRSIPISSALAQRHTHKWRSEADAILVGYNTWVNDNPALTTRLWPGSSPQRLVLDPDGKLSGTGALFQDQQDPYILTSAEAPPGPGQRVPLLGPDLADWPRKIADWCHLKGLALVLVEGGAFTHNLFLETGLWNEIRVWVAPQKADWPEARSSWVRAPQVPGAPARQENHGTDQLWYFFKD